MAQTKSSFTKTGFPKHITTYLKRLLLVWLAAEFPLLVYWAANLGQIRPSVAVKPALWILLITWTLFSLFTLILRNLTKSTLLMLLFVLLFFTYGHIMNILESAFPAAGAFITSLVLTCYGLLFLVGTFLILRLKHFPDNLLTYFQIIFAILVLFNVAQIFFFDPRITSNPGITTLKVNNTLQTGSKPDIYFIILDAYARDDIISSVYGYDNSAFLKELTSRGFYIPSCALSNYDKTPASVPAVLNLNYLNQMGIPDTALDDLSAHQIDLILNNQADKIFSGLGYQTVTTRGFGAFDDIQDSDIYLNYFTFQSKPDELADRNFAYLFIKTTLLRIVFDGAQTRTATIAGSATEPHSAAIDASGLAYTNADFWYHQTNYVFESLAEIPKKTGNYFVYAHINSPHEPYVYDSDGNFLFDDDTKDDKDLYSYAVSYLDGQVLNLVDTLIKDSDVPPIIILQADHGTHYYVTGIDNHKILSAYYLPGDISLPPYDTITPVNNFRLILHDYFDPTVKLLPDTIFVKGAQGYREVPASCD